MNPDNREKLDRWIDAYVDDRLSPEQRTQFEQLMERDADVRTAVELQNRINQSLTRLFAPPASDNGSAIHGGNISGTLPTSSRPPTARNPFTSRRVLGLALAASLLIAAAVGWQYWMNMDMEPGRSGPVVRRYTLAEAYREVEKGDFKAEWLCKDDKEFAQTFYSRLGQALAMAAPPSNVVPTGVSYVALTRSETPQSVEVIAKIGNRGVVVFVDKSCKFGGPEDVGPGLFVHTRQLAKLTLCEVSPFDKPVMLDLLTEREIPDDWKMAPSYSRVAKRPGSAQSQPVSTSSEEKPPTSKWKPPKP